VKLKTENTIIVPRVMNIAVPGGMAVMNNPAHDMNLSVKEFAESRGFEKILGFRPPMGLSLVGLKNAKYESMEDGSLRCMLEYDFAPEEETFPEQRLLHIWEVIVVEYREDDISPDHIRVSPSQNLQILAELQVNISPQTRKSREADAHELAGYNWFIDYMTVTPREDGGVQFTMMADAGGRHSDEIRFFTAALMDAEGKQLCQTTRIGRGGMIESDKEFWYWSVPAEHAEVALAEQVTIQLLRMDKSQWYEMDTFTYTME